MTDTIHGAGLLAAMMMIATGVYLVAGLGACLLVCGGLILCGVVQARRRLQ